MKNRIVALVGLCLLPLLMAAKTFTFTVSNTTFTAVRAKTNCYQITVFENSINPTQNFKIAVPTATDLATQHVSGERFIFVAPKTGTFTAGQLVGYIETGSASATFAQEEF